AEPPPPARHPLPLHDALPISHRARALATGGAITIERENDKDSVVALREIAEKTISPGDMREMLINSIQKHVEIDEPELVAAPMRSEEHTSELQSQSNIVCRLL